MLTTQHATTSNSTHAPDDVGARENAGYFLLVEALIRQAKTDLGHKCWASGCKSSADCRRRKLTARQFLTALRDGRAPIWADWVALAAAQANMPRVWRS